MSNWLLLDQPHQVRELHRDHAARLQQHLHAADEVVEVRHVREHVVAEQQVGATPRARALAAVSRAEELDHRRDALLDRDLRRRSPPARCPSTGIAALDEVLQQVAVVARDLDDLAVAARARSARSSPRRSGGVLEPARRVRREVGVVGEDLLRRLELLELHQEALLADERAQRDRTAPSRSRCSAVR